VYLPGRYGGRADYVLKNIPIQKEELGAEIGALVQFIREGLTYISRGGALISLPKQKTHIPVSVEAMTGRVPGSPIGWKYLDKMSAKYREMGKEN